MMDIYNTNGVLMTEMPDLSLGYLTDSIRTVHHDAIVGVAEEGHWNTITEYPNGGKDVEWVVDVPGVKAKDAYDEEIPIQIYTPYTTAELRQMYGVICPEDTPAGIIFTVKGTMYRALTAIPKGADVTDYNAEKVSAVELMNALQAQKGE